jgi:hypothetical protein
MGSGHCSGSLVSRFEASASNAMWHADGRANKEEMRINRQLLDPRRRQRRPRRRRGGRRTCNFEMPSVPMDAGNKMDAHSLRAREGQLRMIEAKRKRK